VLPTIWFFSAFKSIILRILLIVILLICAGATVKYLKFDIGDWLVKSLVSNDYLERSDEKKIYKLHLDGDFIAASTIISEQLDQIHIAQKASSWFPIARTIIQSESLQLSLRRKRARLELFDVLTKLGLSDAKGAEQVINGIDRSMLSSTMQEVLDLEQKFINKQLQIGNKGIKSLKAFDFDELVSSQKSQAEIDKIVLNRFVNLIMLGDLTNANKLQERYVNNFKTSKRGALYKSFVTSVFTTYVNENNWEGASQLFDEISDAISTGSINGNYFQDLSIARFYALSTIYPDEFRSSFMSKKQRIINWVLNRSTREYLEKRSLETINEIIEETIERQGDESWEYQDALRTRVMIQLILNNYTDLLELLNKYGAIVEALSSQNPFIQYNYLHLRSLCLNNLGQFDESLKCSEELDSAYSAYYVKQLPYLSNEEISTYVSINDKWQEQFRTILLLTNTQSANEKLYEHVVRNRNLTLQSKSHVLQKLRDEPEKLLKYRQLEHELNFGEFRDSIRTELRAFFTTNNINPELEQLDYNSNSSQSGLSMFEKSIEIVRIKDSLSMGSGYTYYALLIDSREPLSLTRICTEDSLKILLSIDEDLNSKYVKIQRLLSPLMKSIGPDVQKVFIAKEGLFHSISLAGVFDSDPVSWINVYSTYGATGKGGQFVSTLSDSLLVYGDLNYNSSSTESERNTSTFLFDSLSHTSTEIRAIAGLFPNTTVRKKHHGTETQFRKDLQSRYDLIHFATHGFYKSSKNTTSNSDYNTSLHNSSIVLANPNLTGNDSTDGILTAFDFSSLDLSGCKLVVLSACNSAIGTTSEFEGIYGFQRAAKQAGAEYFIGTLWSIPDFESSEFMATFYEHLKNDFSIDAAFLATQVSMSDRYQDKRKWAGFVLIH